MSERLAESIAESTPSLPPAPSLVSRRNFLRSGVIGVVPFLIGHDSPAPRKGSPENRNLLESNEIPIHRWLIDKMLKDARYKEVMSVLMNSVDDFAKDHPDRYLHAVALAKYLEQHPDEFEETYHAFIAALQNALEHEENSTMEQAAGTTLITCVTLGMCEEKLQMLREHDAALDEKKRVNLAQMFPKEALKRRVVLALNPGGAR